jgi:MFS family permease
LVHRYRFHQTGFTLLFRYPDYGKLWFGNVVSSFGDQAGWIALVWLLLHMTKSASAIGWVTLLYQLPSVLTSPIAGVLLDRFPRARVMAAGNIILALLFCAITLVSPHLASASAWLIYVLVGAAGVVLPLNTTGGNALLPELIPQDKLSQANFLMQTEWQLALVLGPAIGGALVGAIGPEAVLAFDAGTFMIAALVLLSLPVSRSGGMVQRKSPLHDFQTGFRYLLANRPLVALSILTVLFNFLYGPYEVILPVLAKTIFGGPNALGLLWTTFAMGSLVGSIVFSLRTWPYSLSISLASIIILWGVLTIGMAYAHALFLAMAFMFVGGVVYAPWGALVMTVRQKIIPSDFRARVTGTTISITISGMPIGAWVTGMILGDVQPHAILLASGMLTVAIGAWACLWSDFRKIDS